MASEMRIELIQVPVSDIDRAKSFYVDKVGFSDDHDYQVSNELRFVQLTPPGSSCSIALTSGTHTMAPGSIDGLQMVVDDAEASRKELTDRGVETSEVQVFPWGIFKGVTIGDHSVIGAQAVVRQSVPPDVVVIGNPHQIVGHLDPGHRTRMALSQPHARSDPGVQKRRRYCRALALDPLS